MSARTALAVHEPTAWLRGAVTRALAVVDSLDLPAETSVVAPLGRTGGRDDRTCDRCGRYVPEGPAFHAHLVVPRPGVHLVVGLCQGCRDLERGERR